MLIVSNLIHEVAGQTVSDITECNIAVDVLDKLLVVNWNSQ
jgi:hypothetical protein